MSPASSVFTGAHEVLVSLDETAALLSVGISASDARQIALAGFEASWCSPEEMARLLADAAAGIRALDALLDTRAKESTT